VGSSAAADHTATDYTAGVDGITADTLNEHDATISTSGATEGGSCPRAQQARRAKQPDQKYFMTNDHKRAVLATRAIPCVLQAENNYDVISITALQYQ